MDKTEYNRLIESLGGSLVNLVDPSPKILEVLKSKSPKDAYIGISTSSDFRYGGKAAGRILSAFYLPQLALDDRIKERIVIPHGFALNSHGITLTLESISDWFVEHNVSEVLVRSSAVAEDTFENNWAGLGRTERVRVENSDQLSGAIMVAFMQGERHMSYFLNTRYNVVVDEVIPVSTIAVIHSESPVSVGKIDVAIYFGNPGKFDLYSRGDEVADSINLVDRNSFSVLSVPRVTKSNLWKRGGLMLDERKPLQEWFALRSSLESSRGNPIVGEETVAQLESLLSSRDLPDFRTYVTNYHQNQPTPSQIQDIARIAKAYEDKFGFGLDIEVGIDNKTGKYYIFQIRPIVPKVLRARRQLPLEIKNVIFSTQVVNNEFEYNGPLYIKPDNRNHLESLVKVFDPREEHLQRTGKEQVLFGDMGDKGRYSVVQIGNLRKNIVSGVTGHGKEWVVEAPVDDLIFIHPHIYSFVRAIGEEVRDGTFRTPFDVHIISDGRVGFISIPNRKDFSRYRRLAEQKVQEYEQHF